MSNRGYGFESETEGYFLELEGKNRQDPILDGRGKLLRSFRVPTSGMMASFPGDVITANEKFPQQFMVECKARYDITKRNGQVFRLDPEWVTKNLAEARAAAYLPLFMLSFKKTKTDRIWIVLDQETFNLFDSPTTLKTAATYTYKVDKNLKYKILVKKDLKPPLMQLDDWALISFNKFKEYVQQWMKC